MHGERIHVYAPRGAAIPVRRGFRQICEAVGTYVEDFAESSKHPPHAARISPNLRSNRHMRRGFRHIFQATTHVPKISSNPPSNCHMLRRFRHIFQATATCAEDFVKS